MWVCYPQAGSPSGLPNRALIWNWISGAWGQLDLPQGTNYATPHISSGVVDTDVVSDAWAFISDTWETVDRPWVVLTFNPGEQSPLLAADKLYKGDESNTQSGVTMSAELERTGIPLGEQDQVVRVKALYPRITGSSAVSIQVGTHLNPGESVSYATPVLFMPGAKTKIDVRKTGTHAAIKITSAGDQDWELSGYDIEFDVVGRR